LLTHRCSRAHSSNWEKGNGEETGREGKRRVRERVKGSKREENEKKEGERKGLVSERSTS